MWTVENHFKVIIGGNTYIDVRNLVVFKGQTLFTLKRSDENGELGIYFELYDKARQHVASIKRNQIYPTAGQRERYAFDGSDHEVKLLDTDTEEIVCSIQRRSATSELEVSVRLYTPEGILFDATPTVTNLGGIKMSGNVFQNCGTAILIG